ncbi:hypothetical protein AYO42_06155 [Rhizomicrobium sp. SCGC AG-212-E05]|nr:hypothetical protein AYO42_06155 [Rhizomicrobium sp. SCGC AG-212-E05]
MQSAQYNYVKLSARGLAVLALIFASSTASSGQFTRPAKPDPLLDGGDTSACMAGADLAAGTDATGGGVIPADVGAPPTPVPDEIMVPLGGGQRAQTGLRGRDRNPVTGTGEGAYAGFDGRRMAPLLSPKPCPR